MVHIVRGAFSRCRNCRVRHIGKWCLCGCIYEDAGTVKYIEMLRDPDEAIVPASCVGYFFQITLCRTNTVRSQSLITRGCEYTWYYINDAGYCVAAIKKIPALAGWAVVP